MPSPLPVDWTTPGTQRITLGRVWTRNFPGTVGLYGCVDLMTHSYSYKVGDEPHDSTHALLGYVAVEPLTGMQSLQGSLTLAASRVLMSRHLLLLPQVTVDASGAYIEPQVSIPRGDDRCEGAPVFGPPPPVAPLQDGRRRGRLPVLHDAR